MGNLEDYNGFEHVSRLVHTDKREILVWLDQTSSNGRLVFMIEWEECELTFGGLIL